MIEYLRDFARDGNEINAKEMLTSFNLDVICSVGFGIEAKSFSDSESKLTEMVRMKMGRTRNGLRSVTVLICSDTMNLKSYIHIIKPFYIKGSSLDPNWKV